MNPLTNQPYAKDILTVIKNFERVLPMAKGKKHLDMLQGQVNCEHECGTVHCAGGWFAIAACNLNNNCDYEDGAIKLANILGFKYKYELKDWAQMNRKVWGNDNGIAMFAYNDAYISESRPNGALTLTHIVEHWKEVYERVKALEDAVEVKVRHYKNITTELAVLPAEEVSDKAGVLIAQEKPKVNECLRKQSM